MKTFVFCAGAPDPDLSILQEIAVDILVGIDRGATTLVTHGYTPDWAIGDFDSSPPPECSRQILQLPSDKDDTDLEIALLHVLQQYQEHQISQIIIIGAMGGGRIDHLLTNVWLAHQARFAPYLHKMRFIERQISLRFYTAGEHVWLHESDKKYVSFIGLTPIVALNLHGVKYPLEARNFQRPMALVSNECTAHVMRFSFERGLLCVIQSKDA